MKTALVVTGIVVALVFAIARFAPGNEVVYLVTYEGGASFRSRLWVLDDGYVVWLRAGGPDRTWLRRLEAEPAVELERSGRTRAYRAAPDPDPRVVARVNALMREKYGLADRLFCAAAAPSAFVPVRHTPGP